MTQEQYVGFDTAKLLKEKGFDVFVKSSYDVTGGFHQEGYFLIGNNDISAPTQALVMRWLREVYNLYIQIMLDSWALGSHSGYYVVIQRVDNDFEMMLSDALDDVFYKTHEEACEAAIKYCLENLI